MAFFVHNVDDAYGLFLYQVANCFVVEVVNLFPLDALKQPINGKRSKLKPKGGSHETENKIIKGTASKRWFNLLGHIPLAEP